MIPAGAQFLVAAAVIILAGTFLTRAPDTIADQTAGRCADRPSGALTTAYWLHN